MKKDQWRSPGEHCLLVAGPPIWRARSLSGLLDIARGTPDEPLTKTWRWRR